MNRHFFVLCVIIFGVYVFYIDDNPEVQNKIMDYKDYLIAQAQQINFTGSEILFVIFFAPLFALMVYDALISKK